MCSYVGSDGEVEVVDDDIFLDCDHQPNSLVRRDVIAPAGKLGILVVGDANHNGGHGPEVHALQPGSPMEGLIYVHDRIVAINDVDTREFSAEGRLDAFTDAFGGHGRQHHLCDGFTH